MRILTIILGVLVAIAGFYCCASPVAAQVSLAGMFVIVMGVSMLIGGIGDVVGWFDARSRGRSSAWTLIAGVISIILGIALLGCNFFASGIVFATFVAYFMCIWLIVEGISRIIEAISLRKVTGGANGWVFVLVTGILMVLAGICCFSSPAILIGMMGIVFGVSMIFVGISLISLATAAPAEY